MFLWGGRVLKGRSWGRVDVWGLVERKCKWGSLGVGQMWVF